MEEPERDKRELLRALEELSDRLKRGSLDPIPDRHGRPKLRVIPGGKALGIVAVALVAFGRQLRDHWAAASVATLGAVTAATISYSVVHAPIEPPSAARPSLGRTESPPSPPTPGTPLSTDKPTSPHGATPSAPQTRPSSEPMPNPVGVNQTTPQPTADPTAPTGTPTRPVAAVSIAPTAIVLPSPAVGLPGSSGPPVPTGTPSIPQARRACLRMGSILRICRSRTTSVTRPGDGLTPSGCPPDDGACDPRSRMTARTRLAAPAT